MKTYVRSNSAWSERRRLRICACTETSSAETGSSQTISLGLQRERARDPDPLPLAARELVRIAAGVLGAEADDLEQLSDPELRLPSSCAPWIANGWPHDLLDRLARVQRRVRVLEDHLHLAPQRPELALRESRDVRPSKRIVPDVGSSRRSISRAVVDLPQPDSPTIPSVSPSRHGQRDVLDRVDTAMRAREHALLAPGSAS